VAPLTAVWPRRCGAIRGPFAFRSRGSRRAREASPFTIGSICVTPLSSAEPATDPFRPAVAHQGENIMLPHVRPRPVRLWIHLSRRAGRLLAYVLRIALVGLAMGVAPPSLVAKFVRHEDPTAQVEEEAGESRS
jgi:hypothetical protein